MTIAGIFLLVAFLAGVVAIVIWPLLQAQDEPLSSPDQPALARLQSEHEALLIAIRDLDFDYQTGKLTEEDYRAQRESLVQRGVDLLKQIDARESDLIENAVQAQRQAAASAEHLPEGRRARRTRRTQKT